MIVQDANFLLGMGFAGELLGKREFMITQFVILLFIGLGFVFGEICWILLCLTVLFFLYAAHMISALQILKLLRVKLWQYLIFTYVEGLIGLERIKL